MDKLLGESMGSRFLRRPLNPGNRASLIIRHTEVGRWDMICGVSPERAVHPHKSPTFVEFCNGGTIIGRLGKRGWIVASSVRNLA